MLILTSRLWRHGVIFCRLTGGFVDKSYLGKVTEGIFLISHRSKVISKKVSHGSFPLYPLRVKMQASDSGFVIKSTYITRCARITVTVNWDSFQNNFQVVRSDARCPLWYAGIQDRNIWRSWSHPPHPCPVVSTFVLQLWHWVHQAQIRGTVICRLWSNCFK